MRAIKLLTLQVLIAVEILTTDRVETLDPVVSLRESVMFREHRRVYGVSLLQISCVMRFSST